MVVLLKEGVEDINLAVKTGAVVWVSGFYNGTDYDTFPEVVLEDSGAVIRGVGGDGRSILHY